MKRLLQSEIVALGLAIFSMLFGAGNLVYPLAVGAFSGTKNAIGMTGFMATAICLPLIGIITMILYNGDYETFFRRLGKKSGDIMILICMIIMGPLIAMPRIVTLSHSMVAPFLPFDFLSNPSMLSSFIFALIFLGITFLFTYRESKIVDILGYVVSPALLISLMYIIIKGMLCADYPIYNTQTNSLVFFTNLLRGYETLDLLGALFFSSIILTILRANPENHSKSEQQFAFVGLQGGLIGISLLAVVYVGMSILGMYYGHGLEQAELFRGISIRVLGGTGTLIVATAVLMACLSTAIALAAVIAEYAQHTLFKNKISYTKALLLTLASCLPLSTFGLSYVLALTAGPVTFVGYPVLIVLTLCNLSHKLWGTNFVRIPVLATFFLSLSAYFYW
jgi:LIVCS family branched-chain amino acid:cation transporter